ncbi:response regulator transcription factor [Streptomyces sp. NA04227]|uniref:helix-turn-helix transcriptional regulator n=1 Tax=Streptomyces sp. NA04227 TaxID=2742136 RepID=UPI0015910984|nr:LuxR C-terminal-related transcriptional regulator [Streptomyces sp. NA04227]QKW06893.1 response regulator transcription factor [Streptomyces sp. NA04227]
MSEASKLAIYLELMARGEADSAVFAAELGLSPAEAEGAWSSLESLGLLRRLRQSQGQPQSHSQNHSQNHGQPQGHGQAPGHGGPPSLESARSETGQLIPVSPEAALLRVLRHHRSLTTHYLRESRDLERALEALIDVYLPAATATRSEVRMSIASGPGELRQAVRDLFESAQETVSVMHDGPTPSLLELRRSLNEDRYLTDRGIRVRRLHLQRHALSTDAVVHFEAALESGVEVRLAPVVPMYMFIADTSMAVLPLAPDEPEEGMAVLRGATLVRSPLALYEHLWQQATPFTPGVPGRDQVELTEEQIAIVRMLAEGVKDGKIARSLGISVRTVSRKISDLMHHLGVSSRFAAGARAAQLGLLDPRSESTPDDNKTGNHPEELLGA